MEYHNAFAEQDQTLNMTDQMDDCLILFKDAAPCTCNKSSQIKRTNTKRSFKHTSRGGKYKLNQLKGVSGHGPHQCRNVRQACHKSQAAGGKSK